MAHGDRREGGAPSPTRDVPVGRGAIPRICSPTPRCRPTASDQCQRRHEHRHGSEAVPSKGGLCLDDRINGRFRLLNASKQQQDAVCERIDRGRLPFLATPPSIWQDWTWKVGYLGGVGEIDKPRGNTSVGQLDRLMGTNLKGVLLGCRRVIRPMRARERRRDAGSPVGSAVSGDDAAASRPAARRGRENGTGRHHAARQDCCMVHGIPTLAASHRVPV
jgi:hypothetical protein